MVYAIPKTALTSTISGSAARPTHAPPAANSFASPCPNPSRPRQRRYATAYAAKRNVANDRSGGVVRYGAGVEPPCRPQPCQQRREGNDVREDKVLRIDPSGGQQHPAQHAAREKTRRLIAGLQHGPRRDGDRRQFYPQVEQSNRRAASAATPVQEQVTGHGNQFQRLQFVPATLAGRAGQCHWPPFRQTPDQHAEPAPDNGRDYQHQKAGEETGDSCTSRSRNLFHRVHAAFSGALAPVRPLT